MARRSDVQKKVYQAHKSVWGFLAYGMIFVSCLLILAGITGERGSFKDLTVTPAVTPAPTAVAESFDETPDARELMIPSQSWYALQMGVYESEESAREEAMAYQKRGAAGYLWQDGARWRVLAAVYPAQEDAKSVRDQLRQNQNIDTYVYEIKPASLTLQLNGMKGQLDALQAGFQLIDSVPKSMQNICVSLDSRDADTNIALSHVKTLCDDVRVMKELFDKRFTKPYHQVVNGLSELLSDWETELSRLSNETQSAAALAASLKYATLSLIDSAQAYYQMLIQ